MVAESRGCRFYTLLRNVTSAGAACHIGPERDVPAMAGRGRKRGWRACARAFEGGWHGWCNAPIPDVGFELDREAGAESNGARW